MTDKIGGWTPDERADFSQLAWVLMLRSVKRGLNPSAMLAFRLLEHPAFREVISYRRFTYRGRRRAAVARKEPLGIYYRRFARAQGAL